MMKFQMLKFQWKEWKANVREWFDYSSWPCRWWSR